MVDFLSKLLSKSNHCHANIWKSVCCWRSYWTACMIATSFHAHSRGQMYCEVDTAKPDITISRTIIQEMSMFGARHYPPYMRWRRLQQRGLSARQPLRGFSSQCSRERNGESGASNDKAEDTWMLQYRLFQASLCAVFWWPYTYLEAARRTLVGCYNSISAQAPCTWWDDFGQQLSMRQIHL